MIVICTKNKRSDLPEAIREYGYPEGNSEDDLDVSTGKHYLAYAVRESPEWEYLVHTDTINAYMLWWMPSESGFW